MDLNQLDVNAEPVDVSSILQVDQSRRYVAARWIFFLSFRLDMSVRTDN